MQYHDYYMHKVLLFYVPPVLLVIGTVGNALSLCVLVRRSMRRTSTYNYLAVLSVTDMLILYVGLLRLWIGELTGMEVRDMSDWGCKIITMAGYTVSVCSVWLLIAVTVERYIVTVHSLHAGTMCTRARAVKVIIAILLTLTLTNSHFLWTAELGVFEMEDEENVTICTSSEGHEYLVEQVWPWVDAFFYCFSPFVIICILNGLIVHKVILSRQQRRLLSASTTANSTAASSRNTSSQSESSVRVTIMLLTISFTFLVCTLPMNAVMIKSAFLSYDTATIQDIAQYKLARTVSELLMYTNHSINFYLYLV